LSVSNEVEEVDHALILGLAVRSAQASFFMLVRESTAEWDIERIPDQMRTII